MNGNFLLDTNIIIALFDNDENVKNEIDKANLIFIPSIVVGELFYGAFNSGNRDKNIQKIKEFCQEVQIISCDFDTAIHYGQIKKQLKEIGKPIPENDIWIAAVALQHHLTLVSRDSHIENVKNIDLVNWQ